MPMPPGQSGSIVVLHVVFSLDPGGMENGIVNLTNGLTARGIESHVFCLDRPGRFADRICENGRVHTFGQRTGFSLRAVAALRETIAKLRPSIIHSHNLGPLIYSSLATFGGRTVPIVHGEHSELTPDELKPRRYFQRLLLFRTCSAIHTVSRQSRQQLTDSGFPQRIIAIPNGVDTERFVPGGRASARRALGLPETGPVLGVVGRFGEFKHHDLMIRAFESLPEQNVPAHLLIAGEGGPEECQIREQARSSPAAERIHFTGFVAQPEKLYPALDLLMVPSSNEGLSNVVLEAMSCGIPAFSNAACGAAEAITSGVDGFVAEIDSASGLAEKTRSVLSDPDGLARAGIRAREKVIEQFSITAMLARYTELYRSVLRRSVDAVALDVAAA